MAVAVVMTTAALFMLAVLVASGIVLMVQREADRVERRTGLIAERPSPTDLLVSEGDDLWRGEQFPVYWIAPAENGAATVLPPGLTRLPAPGQAVVSPALDRLASDDPGVARRYPARLVIQPQGLQNEDELLAYVRVPDGRSLPGHLADNLGGDTTAVRIEGFGPAKESAPRFGLEPFFGLMSVTRAIEGVIGFLVVPSLFVLVAGIVAASGVRGGARPGRPGGLQERVLGLSLPAVPGLVGTALLWAAASPRLERVPLVGRDAIPGDLRLPWWLVAGEVGASLVLTVIVASMVVATKAIHGRYGPTWSRLAARRSVLVALSLTPLALALTALTVDLALGGGLGRMPIYAATLLAVTVVTLVLPDALVAALGRLRWMPVRAAGDAMERDPSRATRPFIGAAVLVVVALVGGGFAVGEKSNPEDASLASVTGTQASVFVQWLDPLPDDPNLLAKALDPAFVAPFGEGGEGDHSHGSEYGSHDSEHGSTLIVGSACRQMATQAPGFRGMECDPDEPYELPDWARSRLAEILAPASHGSAVQPRLAPPDEVADSGSAVILSDGASVRVLDARAREAAMRAVPAPYVHSSPSAVNNSPPFHAWISSGMFVAFISLTIGYLLLLAAHMRCQTRRPLDARESSLESAAFEAWLFAAPYYTAVVLGFSAGLAVCTLVATIYLSPMPWDGIKITAATAMIVGIVGTAGAAMVGSRSVNTMADSRGAVGKVRG